MWGYCNFMALEYFKWNKTNRFLWIFCEAKTLLRKVYIFWPLKYNARLFSYFCLWFYFHCMYSLVKKKKISTQNHPPELQMVYFYQLNIYIWIPCRYLKTHDENLSIAILHTQSMPQTFSLPHIPYSVEESIIHPTPPT